MPETLEIEVLDGIVRASVSGKFILENAKSFLQQIVWRAKEELAKKVLIDARDITTDISAMARYDIGTFIAKQDVHTLKIAFVGHEDAVWPDRFLETVSVNRGANAKVVTETRKRSSGWPIDRQQADARGPWSPGIQLPGGTPSGRVDARKRPTMHHSRLAGLIINCKHRRPRPRNPVLCDSLPLRPGIRPAQLLGRLTIASFEMHPPSPIRSATVVAIPTSTVLVFRARSNRGSFDIWSD
jgi:hypothetical protein